MKKERVNFAEILIASGFNRMKILNLFAIPLAVELTIEANAVDAHEVNLVYDAVRRIAAEVPNKPFIPETPLMPNFDHVESLVVNDGTGDWSIDRSKITIRYNDGSQSSIYFGESSSGLETDSKRPLTHRATIPPANGWPPLKTENPQYPISVN